MDEKRRYEEAQRYDDGLQLAPAPAERAPEVVPYQLYHPPPAAAHVQGQQPPPNFVPVAASSYSAAAPVHNNISPTAYSPQTGTIGAYSLPGSPEKGFEQPVQRQPTLQAGDDGDQFNRNGSRGGSSSGRRRTICGCGVLVFVLSAVIALLGAACIGLAAGTGIEANRANDYKQQVALMSAVPAKSTVTVTASGGGAAATPSFNDLSHGCTNDPINVSGQSYTSPKSLGQPTFTIYCNKDATGTNLLSLFASSIETCMDACAAFTFYEPKNFGATHVNATCRSISFIPMWTDKAKATEGEAPGNCYLKPGGTTGGLQTPNIGTECHAAVLSAGK